MKKVYLSLDDIDLGYLTKSEDLFQFVADEVAIKEAEQTNPLAMKLFKLNRKGKMFFDELPNVFRKFLVSNLRKDIISKADIIEEDNDFERLFKLAGLNMMNITFKIHQ